MTCIGSNTNNWDPSNYTNNNDSPPNNIFINL